MQICTTFVVAVLARLIDLASRLSRRMKSGVTIAALAGHTVSAQITPPSQPLASLKSVPIPGPDYTGYVKDKSKAIALGKAFFWDMQIGSDNLSDQDKDDLVAFLKALTDERVRYEKAPFDHPQLFIHNGHPGNETFVTNDGTGKATDAALLEIPSVGRNGRSTPPSNFLATP